MSLVPIAAEAAQLSMPEWMAVARKVNQFREYGRRAYNAYRVGKNAYDLAKSFMPKRKRQAASMQRSYKRAQNKYGGSSKVKSYYKKRRYLMNKGRKRVSHNTKGMHYKALKENVFTRELNEGLVVKKTHPKYIGSIIRHDEIRSGITSSGAGTQNIESVCELGRREDWIGDGTYAAWHKLNPNRMFNPNSTTDTHYTDGQKIATEKFACQSVTNSLFITNQANTSCMIDVYYVVRKLWGPENAKQCIERGLAEMKFTASASKPGAGSGAVGTFGVPDLGFVGVSPAVIPYFKKNYRILKKEEVNLDPSQTKTIHTNITWNQVYDESVYKNFNQTELKSTYPRGQMEVLVVQHGVPCFDKTTAENPKATLSNSTLAIVVRNHLRFRQVKGAADETVKPYFVQQQMPTGAAAGNQGFIQQQSGDAETYGTA